MEQLLNYNLEELKEICANLGLKPFRATQVFTALHKGLTLNECTTLNNQTKELLQQNYIGQPVSILQTISSADGTQKFLFQLPDHNIVEGVLMQYKFGKTLCVSTQVGCAMGCKFCASGLDGLLRNLTAGEILGQVIAVNKQLGGKLGEERAITNVVLMESGEPLANYDNVTKFNSLVTHKNGLMMSERNITLSTCGIATNIKKLADDGYKVNLSISLHAPTDEIRKSIMKVANSFSIAQILQACDYYALKTNRRISYEYILIKNVNANIKHAQLLGGLLQGKNVQVNLIPLNEVKEVDLKTISKQQALEFKLALQKYGINATVRRTLGDDIEGACGQLRRHHLNTN